MTATTPTQRAHLQRYAWLSIAAALLTIALKGTAWQLTGSVAVLSDALESGVNLFAAVLALFILRVAARPADDEHAYGHAKAEYFAAGIEGALILAAAIAIVWASIPRLIDPAPVEQVGVGLAVTAIAAVLNLVVGRTLITAGRRHESIALEADGHHLLADVWTSAAVIVAIAAVALTGWERLDPAIAIAVAVNVVFAGTRLIMRSTGGLMDRALPAEDVERITSVLNEFTGEGIEYHALRTRTSGHHAFMSVHVLVPGAWTVQRGHDLLERIEARLRDDMPSLTVFTHLEPIEDPSSFEDTLITPEREITDPA